MKEDASIIRKEESTTIWGKKKYSSKEDRGLALLTKDKENEWYIYNGCSTHMTGDQNKFISLKEGNNGSISFGNDFRLRWETFI